MGITFGRLGSVVERLACFKPACKNEFHAVLGISLTSAGCGIAFLKRVEEGDEGREEAWRVAGMRRRAWDTLEEGDALAEEYLKAAAEEANRYLAMCGSEKIPCVIALPEALFHVREVDLPRVEEMEEGERLGTLRWALEEMQESDRVACVPLQGIPSAEGLYPYQVASLSEENFRRVRRAFQAENLHFAGISFRPKEVLIDPIADGIGIDVAFLPCEETAGLEEETADALYAAVMCTGLEVRRIFFPQEGEGFPWKRLRGAISILAAGIFLFLIAWDGVQYALAERALTHWTELRARGANAERMEIAQREEKIKIRMEVLAERSGKHPSLPAIFVHLGLIARDGIILRNLRFQEEEHALYLTGWAAGYGELKDFLREMQGAEQIFPQVQLLDSAKAKQGGVEFSLKLSLAVRP